MENVQGQWKATGSDGKCSAAQATMAGHQWQWEAHTTKTMGPEMTVSHQQGQGTTSEDGNKPALTEPQATTGTHQH